MMAIEICNCDFLMAYFSLVGVVSKHTNKSKFNSTTSCMGKCQGENTKYVCGRSRTSVLNIFP